MFILPAAFGAFYRQGKGLGFMTFIVHEFADVCSAVARLLRCVVLAVVERKTERCLVAGRVGVYFEPFRRTYNFPGFPFLFRTWGGVIFTVQILYLFLMHLIFTTRSCAEIFSSGQAVRGCQNITNYYAKMKPSALSDRCGLRAPIHPHTWVREIRNKKC